VFVIGFVMLAFGVACLMLLGSGAGIAGVLLALAIVVYDWLHKNTALAPLLMALCRWLIYPTAALAASGALSFSLLWGATGLFCYIAGLTYAAKQEAFDRVERMWPLAIMAVPFGVGFAFTAAAPNVLPVLALFALWTAGCLYLLGRRRVGDIGRAVSLLLAGISLYDAVLVSATGSASLGIVCVAAALLTVAAQRYLPGT
jgi:4-hydroxybenzoate polyprenyltransferase